MHMTFKSMLWVQKLRCADLGAFALGILVGLGFAYQIAIYSNLLVKYNEYSASNLKRLMVESKTESGPVKLLCWILTGPENHWRAVHVRETWGKECDKLLFMSSSADSNLSTTVLKDVKEGRYFLWAKTKEALKHVYKYHFDEYGWFMKADDDTFVVVDRLKALLKGHNPNDPIWFGSRYITKSPFVPLYTFKWMTGGSGYVLSREALRRFVEQGLSANTTRECKGNFTRAEDYNLELNLGHCITKLGVEAGNSRDSAGRDTFFQYRLHEHLRPELYLTPDSKKSQKKFMRLIQKKGYPECCSDKPISFHCVRAPYEVYVFDYLLNYADMGGRRRKENLQVARGY